MVMLEITLEKHDFNHKRNSKAKKTKQMDTARTINTDDIGRLIGFIAVREVIKITPDIGLELEEVLR
jgi:hypothetical protein